MLATNVISMPRKTKKPQTIDRQWFTIQLDRVGLSQNTCAERMGLDRGSLSKTLNGQRRLKIEEAAQLALQLGVSMSEVLAHAGVIDWQTATHKSEEAVVVSATVDATHNVRRQQGLGKIPRPAGMGADVEALVYRTAATKLDMLDGWVLYVRPLGTDVAADSLGRLSLVKLSDGREMVGFLRRGIMPRSYQLWDFSGPVMQEVQLEAATPVLWVQP